MSPSASPAAAWTRAERAVLRRLSTPARIQAYLDGLQYRAEDRAACPRKVLVEGRAHCYDGAIFAAAALAELGHPPLLLDMWAVRDDDHVLAVYRVDGYFGAIAKSNFVGLRFREPVYRTLRELVLSYFELYFNAAGEKTLRAFSGLLDLRRFDRLGWRFDDAPLPFISDRLDALPHRKILTRAMERRLQPVDPRSMEAGMLGTLREGLYAGGAKPRRAAR
ncbi:hypothetical protein [Anaeromyxobacter oryzae]|uniref:Transglutaminase-like domain-containing protein n=1 Tax=Anaeromyxobacter oryzae TaxID=2918170 RepID=A0ABM7X2H6_9BACT|nr:hypothetical protein [Anaeromyxobacter oryzae]BDG05983.1 hypothetical protein AMOR_49790 [Anaeromyxobacter oryzae]